MKAIAEQPPLPGLDGFDEERRLLEGRAERRIRAGLGEQLSAALPEGTTPENVAGAEERMLAAGQGLQDSLYTSLVEGALLGVDVGRQQAEGTGISTNWTLVNAEAREWAREHAGELIRDLNETTARVLREAITGWINNDLSYDELLKEIGDAFGPERAQRIAETEITRAYAEGNRRAWAASGVIEEMVWRTAADERVCEICGALNGQVVAVRGGTFTHPGGEGLERWAGSTYANPPAHPRCLPGHARVAAEGIAATSERWYDGDLVVIRTTSGKQLACTPNHPILTPSGWVAAGLLDVGGHVISSLAREWLPAGADLDDKDVPARIEDVAKAFGRSEQVAAVPVPLAAEDFHGDGIGSQVAVIRADGLLGNRGDASFGQHLGEQQLSGRGMEAAVLDRSGVAQLTAERDGSPLRCRMCGHELVSAGSFRHTSPLDRFGLALTADGHASAHKPLTNGPTVDLEGFGNSVLGFAGQIAPDEIVNIERAPFSGHVYNLQTASECYVAEGILTHNCRCWLVPEVRSRG